MRAARVGLVLVVFAALLGVGTTASAGPPATITGHLVDNVGADLAGTIVPRFWNGSGFITLPTEVTAPDGSFSFQVADEGTYRIGVFAPGHVALEVDVYPTAGETYDLGDVSLEPGETLSGVVRDTVGQPLAGVDVIGLTFTGVIETTGADGAYSFVVPDGEHTIVFLKDSYVFECSPTDATAFEAGSCTETALFSAGGSRSLDVTLVQAGWISGTLTADGAPVDALVQVLDASTGAPAAATVVMNGAYSVGPLRPGTYLARSLPNDPARAGAWYDGANSRASSTPIVVSEGAALTDVDFAYVVGGTLTGVVTTSTGEPASGVAVRIDTLEEASDPSFGAAASKFTNADADGAYSFEGLGATQWVVSAAPNSGSRTYHPSATTPAAATPVTVEAGVASTGIDIQLSPTVSGTVRLVKADGSNAATGFSGAALCPTPTVLVGFTCSGGPLGPSALANNATGIAPLANITPGSYNLGALVNFAVAGTPYPLTLVAGDSFDCTFVVDGPGSTCAITNAGGPPDDEDGVPSPVEDGAPNGGDGNGDGTLDSEQANVTSLPAEVGTGYVTIAAPDGVEVSSVTVTDLPPSPSLPPGASIDAGVIAYTLSPVSNGGSVDVEITLSGGVTANSYLKLQGGAWVELPSSAFTIAGNTITLHLVDGGIGDEDGQANGTIVDPGAPANLDKTPPTITCPAPPKPLFRATGATLAATVTDGGSGPAAATSTVPLVTTTAGLRTVTVTASDLAGNDASRSCGYQVVYDVRWVIPLGGPGTRSAPKGDVVPLTFRLVDAQGRGVSGAVVSAPTSTATTCPAGKPPLVLSYEGPAITAPLGEGFWLAGWKAEKAWKGTCRLVKVPLADGTAPSMVIKVV